MTLPDVTICNNNQVGTAYLSLSLSLSLVHSCIFYSAEHYKKEAWQVRGDERERESVCVCERERERETKKGGGSSVFPI